MKIYNKDKPLFSIHIPKSGGTSLISILQGWYNKRDCFFINNHPRFYKLMTKLNVDIDFLYQRLFGCGLYLHYSNEIINRNPRKVPLGRKYGIIRRNKIPECVHGHFDPQTDGGNLLEYYPYAEQMITFLRDPLEMQISLFYYLKKRIDEGNMYWQGKKVTKIEFGGNIDQWVEERDLYMLRFLPFKLNENNYKDILNRYFVHIGITEEMQKSVDIMADKLGFRRIQVPKENVTKRTGRPSESAIRIFKSKHQLEYNIYEFAQELNK